jgi:hypothetical protein
MIHCVDPFSIVPPLVRVRVESALSVLLLILCCQFPAAQANQIILDESDSGNLLAQTTVGTVYSHNAGFDGVSAGFDHCGPTCIVILESSGYLIFDLSAVAVPVLGLQSRLISVLSTQPMDSSPYSM